MIEPKVLRIACPPEVCRFVPETADSHILGGSEYLQNPIDLDKYDYVEEEYIVKGSSNVYHWDDNERYPHILISGAPYCTRIIVRKPRDPGKFSGIIHCELFNPNSGFDRSNSGWAPCHEYLMSRGHGSISFTISEVSMKNMRLFDPERYGELGFRNPIPEKDRMPAALWLNGKPIDETTEDGLQYDFYSQLAALVKSGRADSPFAGYCVKKMMLQGTTGGNLSAYVAGIHPITKLPDGTSCFDGFLIVMTGAPGFLNNSRYMLDPFDFRDLYYSEVPFIHLYTVADLLGDTMHPSWATTEHRYQPNEKGRYLRLIEVAGAGVPRKYTEQFVCCPEDIAKVRRIQAQTEIVSEDRSAVRGSALLDGTGADNSAASEDSAGKEKAVLGILHSPVREGIPLEFPTHLIICALIEGLTHWMLTGEAPEKVDWIRMKGDYPDIDFDRDKYGVFQGGLRSPYVDCPLCATNSSGIITHRLTDEELKELYTSRADYLAKVTASVESMIAHGHLLPEHAHFIIDEAKQAELPFED